MLTPRSIPFLQNGRILRRVRADVQRRLQEEPALRLQPSLLDLPVLSPSLTDLAVPLSQPGVITLCGAPGSGRSLAILQLHARWAESGMSGPVVSLSLTNDDAANLSPRAIVAGAIHRAGLPPTYAEGNRSMLLLIDDWEDLSADRRALWRSYLFAATGWASARVVVSLPPEERWPGVSIIDLVPPADAMLESWLGRLLPGHDVYPILAALQHEPLAALRSSVTDLLLLALVYPIVGLPDSRATIYEQGYALARPLLDEVESRLNVGRAALRHYRLARGLAGGADLASLTTLPAHEVIAVSPLMVGLLGDPRPVLDLLWGDGQPDQTRLHALAACLRERPTAAPAQQLRVVSLLLTSAQHNLLQLVAPALPALPAAAAASDDKLAIRALRELAEGWPGAQMDAVLIAILEQSAAPA
ncbi:MAG: hypothetical protein HGA65_04855, partial [Oscillochloris sp.]|nr:hypothetical protein [Oscillochloris sp.]